MAPTHYTVKVAMISILASLSIASRIILAFLPNISLTTPLTILSGFYLGSLSGFLVGFISMIISDMYLGFGPWTIVTSISMGLVGFLSGLILPRVRDRVLLFVLAYLFTLFYDVVTSILTISVFFGTPVWVALINLFTPVFIGVVPYPMGPVHEFSTAFLSTYLLGLFRRNEYIRVMLGE